MPHSGLRLLVPGYAQWRWGQSGRGQVLFGWFASAIAVSIFAWGTTTGLSMLAFAFLAHVVSILDALRQSSFPGLNPWATRIGVSGGLAAGVYVPILTVASLVAWPGLRGGSEAEGYLVNCWAYRGSEPERDDLVWYRPTPLSEPRFGRIVAGPGQEVAWSENGLSVNGGSLLLAAPFRSPQPPRGLAYRVPEGHVLIHPGQWPAHSRATEPLVIVERAQVVGRVWAQLYPIRERQWLPRGLRPDGVTARGAAPATSHT
jgi:hypothetical protein